MHPKTPVPLPHLPATSGYMQEQSKKACAPVHIPPREPVHTPGDTHLPPFLSHVISGAGKPLASHSRVRDCPAIPDTLALRPSSRRLGGTWEKEKQRSCPSAGQPLPGTPFGPFFLAWRAVRLPPSPASGLQDAHSRPRPSGAVDLGVATAAASPWSSPGTLLALTASSPSCGSHQFPSSSPPKRLAWSPRRCLGTTRPPPMESRVSLGGAWVCL